MYGGSLKFGRGGGPRGGTTAGKRNSFPPPPLQRPSSSSGGRNSLSLRKPSSATPPPPPPETSDESFSLVSGDPLSFAAIIRLAPDLIDEIKRLESQGGAARIKFDSNPTNPSANVRIYLSSDSLMFDFDFVFENLRIVHKILSL